MTVLAVAFIVLLRVLHRSTHVDATWYELRATAEAIKSSAWCYAMRAAPFDPSDQTEEAVERLFLEQLDAATAELDYPPPVEAGDEITPAMRHLHDAPTAEQREVYLEGRLQDQLSWYSGAARRTRPTPSVSRCCTSRSPRSSSWPARWSSRAWRSRRC